MPIDSLQLAIYLSSSYLLFLTIARTFAEATIQEQMKSFKRWGVMANW